jgi:hypothetical protein
MKFPHMSYVSFSPTSDQKDVRRSGFIDLKNLLNKPLIFTTKMDGSNLQITREKVAARNGISADHSSFDYIKQIYPMIQSKVPENLIIYGEWCFAKHSIHYQNLDNYFHLFAVYNQEVQIWESFQQVQFWAEELGFVTVPIVQRDLIFDDKPELEATIKLLGESVIKKGHEGIVIRNANSFDSKYFSQNVAKYVRKNHVQTDIHWKKGPIVKNILKNSKNPKFLFYR